MHCLAWLSVRCSMPCVSPLKGSNLPSLPHVLHATLPLLCKTAPSLTCEAEAVTLQTVVSRETNPLHSQVVSLTRFNTGDNAYNVIPDVVKLGATYRSLTHEGMVRMKDRFDEV